MLVDYLPEFLTDYILKRWLREQLKKPSGFSPGAGNRYAPNAVQQEFIRLCAEKNWYLALADTDHSRPQLQAFAFSGEMVGALGAGGKKLYFIENSPEHQKYYDWLREGGWEARPGGITYVDPQGNQRARESIGGFWMREEDRSTLAAIFEASALSNRDVRFVGADHRLVNDEEYAKLRKRVVDSLLRNYAWEKTLSIGKRIFGAESDVPHKVAKIFTHNPEKMISEAACDDRDTVNYIKDFSEPAAIMFGSGHFDTYLDEPEAPVMMGSLLQQDGKSLCVMQIFQNSAHRGEVAEERNKLKESEYGPAFARADVELFVENTPGIKHGIRILNPALKPLYEQAVKNVQAGLTPQEMTRQFLPS